MLGTVTHCRKNYLQLLYDYLIIFLCTILNKCHYKLQLISSQTATTTQQQ